jgi:hypothetical protein
MSLTPNERMDNAIVLADKCWKKVSRTNPDFVIRYLELAQEVLATKPLVLGDEFRDYCRDNKLFLPETLHHNTWVSGVRALNLIGWIEHKGYTEPLKGHNHMPQVSLWKSNLFEGGWNSPKQLSIF